jgi:hypothetical protein
MTQLEGSMAVLVGPLNHKALGTFGAAVEWLPNQDDHLEGPVDARNALTK